MNKKNSITIEYDLSASEKGLMVKAANDIVRDEEVENILLRPLGRFGKTSAKLFAIRIRTKISDSKSFVLKLDSEKNIKREIKNTGSVSAYFNTPEIKFEDYSKDENSIGVIVLESVGDQELKNELEKFYVKYEKKEWKKIEKYIKIAFIKHNPSSKSGKKNTVDFYFKEYLRDNVGIDNIKKYAENGKAVLGAENVKWGELIECIDLFLKKEYVLSIGPIHGDLHPSNIIVNTKNNNSVSLIDYAWARNNGVSAIDYAMMENSLLYMWAPIWMPERFWGKIDEYLMKDILLDVNERKRFLSDVKECKPDLEEWGRMIWNSISVIRKVAYERDICLNEMLVAKAALLLGQAKFADYAPFRIGHGLSRMFNVLMS